MRKKQSQFSLKQVYYRSFCGLVVIPLLLVFIISMLVVGFIVRRSAIDTIDALQDNVTDTLSSDVKTSSLQLSHFAFVHDGEFLELASQVYSSEYFQHHTYFKQLDRAFRSAMVPSQDIIAGKFYMKLGGGVYMKEDIVVPDHEIREEGWYQLAKEHKNQVYIGCYDSSKMTLTSNSQKGKQLILVTALSPNRQLDRSESIEMITFFVISRAGDIIRKSNNDANLGTTVILDENNNLLYGDMGNELVEQYFANQTDNTWEESFTNRAKLNSSQKRAVSHFFKVRQVPMTNWKIVTFVESAKLTQGFYRVGGFMVTAIILLLGMFYFFLRYFLNAIVAPVQVVVEGMKQLVDNDLEVQVEPEGHSEIRTLMESFNQMVRSLKNMLAANDEEHKHRHNAEIRALQSQINPHFVVNTLNSIRFMAKVAKFDGMQGMTEALMNIVSCSFRSNISFYSVQEELSVLDSYIYLMRIRYSDGFEVRYEVDDACLSYRIPRLILQPIVENSITHGFLDQGDELGEIVISVYKDETFLYLAVHDNGQGMTQQQINDILKNRTRADDDNSSIGLENVLARIRLNFGQKAQMSIESQCLEYTNIVLRMPLDALTTEMEPKD